MAQGVYEPACDVRNQGRPPHGSVGRQQREPLVLQRELRAHLALGCVPASRCVAAVLDVRHRPQLDKVTQLLGGDVRSAQCARLPVPDDPLAGGAVRGRVSTGKEMARIWVNRATRTETARAYYGADGGLVRKVRGFKCRDLASLMSEFGAAFQLFDGFGENWHAVEECLCYLDEWMPAESYTLVVERGDELLSDEPGQLRWFVAVMADVAEWWSKEVIGNGRFDRPPVSFRVVLEGLDPGSPRWRHLQEFGADLTLLPDREASVGDDGDRRQ